MTEKAKTKDKVTTKDALAKMQNQLDAMEKKIDVLLEQSKPKKFKTTHSSKTSDSPRRTGKPRYAPKKETSSSEGKFYHGYPFNNKKTGGKSSARNAKKAKAASGS